MEITFDRKTINNCLQQRFELPTYQREYRWQASHLRELLTDIQDEFSVNYDPSHGRTKVSEYSPYFLGTIITTAGENGSRAIIDGQQRLTTITLILTYIYRCAKSNPDDGISNVEQLIRRSMYGASQFNLELDDDRKELFSLLLDRHDLTGGDLDDAVESIPDISEGTRDLYRRFCEVDDCIPSDFKGDTFSRFADYIIERVYLFEIGVPSQQDGHRVFVTMNDRGLRLSPLDLLKGFLLSNIDDSASNSEANKKWSECIRNLRDLGRDEESAFFKTWLRAQYAITTRGKSRGDAPADFEILGDAYHRWFVEKSTDIGLNNSDEFYNLVSKSIPFFVNQYRRIKHFEENYSRDFRHVFYNGAKGVALQYMVILATLDPNDTSSVIDKKIKITSFYIDAVLTSRLITGRDNNYDNTKGPFFELAKNLRGKNISEIKDHIKPLMADVKAAIEKISQVSYKTTKRQDLLHLLSRLAEDLEDSLELTNKVGFPDYINRVKGAKTFDIEHVVTSKDGVVIGQAADGSEIRTDSMTQVWRDKIGSLILLPRGRNRSLQDKGYFEKLPVYATESILASSLAHDFYTNHPNVSTHIQETGVPLQPVSSFLETSSKERGELYEFLASRIWDATYIDAIAPIELPAPPEHS